MENETLIPPFCFNASVDATTADRETAETIQEIVFWIEGVALFAVAVFGVIGNGLTCAVLSRISLRNVFNQLIVALCVFDSLFCAFAALNYSMKKGLKWIDYDTPVYVNLWPKFVYPLENMTSSASLCVTLAIAIERYVKCEKTKR